mgnify:CR=1 FL=1
MNISVPAASSSTASARRPRRPRTRTECHPWKFCQVIVIVAIQPLSSRGRIMRPRSPLTTRPPLSPSPPKRGSRQYHPVTEKTVFQAAKLKQLRRRQRVRHAPENQSRRNLPFRVFAKKHYPEPPNRLCFHCLVFPFPLLYNTPPTLPKPIPSPQQKHKFTWQKILAKNHPTGWVNYTVVSLSYPSPSIPSPVPSAGTRRHTHARPGAPSHPCPTPSPTISTYQ